MRKKTRKLIGSFSLYLLVLYGCVIIYFFLFSDRLGRVDGYSTYRYNLIPFEEIRRFILYRNNVSTGAFILNLIGNLLVFFPVGFLMPLWRNKKTGGIYVAAVAFLFSLCIETLQLVTKVGVFDVDDLLLNTLGGLVGWICYYASLKVFRFVCIKKAMRHKKKEG